MHYKTHLLDDWIDPGLEVMESGGDLEFVWAWIVNPLANPGFLKENWVENFILIFNLYYYQYNIF